jgi:hypothetical protein
MERDHLQDLIVGKVVPVFNYLKGVKAQIHLYLTSALGRSEW